MSERWEKWREDLRKDNPEINPEYVNRKGVWHHDFYRDRPTALNGGGLSYPSQDDRPAPTGAIGGFNKADLLRRGWTRTSIKRILGQPDHRMLRQGLMGPLRNDRPECVYGRERVLSAERDGRIRFRKASERTPPDERDFEDLATEVEVAQDPAPIESPKKIGTRQRALLAVLNERGGGPMNLTDIAACIWQSIARPDAQGIPRSFYESTRRAACDLAARGVLLSEDCSYRRRFWTVNAADRPPSPKNLWNFTKGKRQTPGSVVERRVLNILGGGALRRYSDVLRGLRMDGMDSVQMSRAVAHLSSQGKIRRIVKTTKAGGKYEVLGL